MSKRMFCAVVDFVILAAAFGSCVTAQGAPGQSASIAEKTKDAQKLAGYFNLYWDPKVGKLWFEIDKWDTEFLYQSSAGGSGFERYRTGPRATGRDADCAVRTQRAEGAAGA